MKKIIKCTQIIIIVPQNNQQLERSYREFNYIKSVDNIINRNKGKSTAEQ